MPTAVVTGPRRPWVSFAVGVTAAVALAIGWRTMHRAPVAAEALVAPQANVVIADPPAPAAPAAPPPTRPDLTEDVTQRTDAPAEPLAKEQGDPPTELPRHRTSRASQARGDGAIVHTNGRKTVTAGSHPRKSAQPAAPSPSPEPAEPASKNNVGILVGDELIK